MGVSCNPKLAPAHIFLLADKRWGRFEQVDSELLKMDNLLCGCISEVADPSEMRQRAHILPSHWWWYLDQITLVRDKAAS